MKHLYSSAGRISGVAPMPVTSGEMLQAACELAGRVLLAALFFVSGIGKIGAYDATVAYMQSYGVPGALLPIVMATEILLPLLLVFGLKTRIAAFLLAGFALVSALIFHLDFSDPVQQVMLLKNVSIAGGLLLLVANGAGAWSLDRAIERSRRRA